MVCVTPTQDTVLRDVGVDSMEVTVTRAVRDVKRVYVTSQQDTVLMDVGSGFMERHANMTVHKTAQFPVAEH